MHQPHYSHQQPQQFGYNQNFVNQNGNRAIMEGYHGSNGPQHCPHHQSHHQHFAPKYNNSQQAPTNAVSGDNQHYGQQHHHHHNYTQQANSANGVAVVSVSGARAPPSYKAGGQQSVSVANARTNGSHSNNINNSSAAAAPPMYAASGGGAPLHHGSTASSFAPVVNAPPPSYGGRTNSPLMTHGSSNNIASNNIAPNINNTNNGMIRTHSNTPCCVAALNTNISVNVGGGMIATAGAVSVGAAGNGGAPVAVPYVVPALTPALSAAVAVIKPSHQVLIVRPLPAFLTEDEDLLALAKAFALPAGHEANTASETRRILEAGDDVVMARIRELRQSAQGGENQKKTEEEEGEGSGQTPSQKKNLSAAIGNHCNYLPFAAKVIRKSVLSAITAANRRSNTTKAAADDEEEELLTNNTCFCEEGYGFLLFPNEEAGLTYLRAVERLNNNTNNGSKSQPMASVDQDKNSCNSGGRSSSETALFAYRPLNVAAVRADFDEIDAIKKRVYEDFAEEDCSDNDGDENAVMNASFSSISSSSCDSATSFDSNSSFESLASEADEEDEVDDRCPLNNELLLSSSAKKSCKAIRTTLDCDDCTRHRRSYRVYYRAKMNRLIDGVRVKCAIVPPPSAQSETSDDTSSTTQQQQQQPPRRPAMFNGVPNASKAHIDEMRGLFARCFFNTFISVAGGDGTVSAKSKTKAVPLMTKEMMDAFFAHDENAAQGRAEDMSISTGAEEVITNALAAVPLSEAEARTQCIVAVQRPIIIDCTDSTATMTLENRIRYMRRQTQGEKNETTPATIACPAGDLLNSASELIHKYSIYSLLEESEQSGAAAAALAALSAATTASKRRPFPVNHHTHHRHCILHRADAVQKRQSIRKAKAIQTRMCSRARQAPLVVTIGAPPPFPAAVAASSAQPRPAVSSATAAVVCVPASAPPRYMASQIVTTQAMAVPPPQYCNHSQRISTASMSTPIPSATTPLPSYAHPSNVKASTALNPSRGHSPAPTAGISSSSHRTTNAGISPLANIVTFEHNQAATHHHYDGDDGNTTSNSCGFHHERFNSFSPTEASYCSAFDAMPHHHGGGSVEERSTSTCAIDDHNVHSQYQRLSDVAVESATTTTTTAAAGAVRYRHNPYGKQITTTTTTTSTQQQQHQTQVVSSDPMRQKPLMNSPNTTSDVVLSSSPTTGGNLAGRHNHQNTNQHLNAGAQALAALLPAWVSGGVDNRGAGGGAGANNHNHNNNAAPMATKLRNMFNLSKAKRF